MINQETYYLITCDQEDGCDEHWAGTSDELQSERDALAAGWTALPASQTADDAHLCPRHSTTTEESRA